MVYHSLTTNLIHKKQCTVAIWFYNTYPFFISVIWSDWKWLQARHTLESWPQTSPPKQWCQMDNSWIWSCRTTEVHSILFVGQRIVWWCDPTAAYSTDNHLHYWRLEWMSLSLSFMHPHIANTTWRVFLSSDAGKYVVFFFYPLDFTFVCPTEIIAFSDAADDFRKIGCEVIGASVDSHFSHFAWWEHSFIFKALRILGLLLQTAHFYLWSHRTNTPRKQGGLGTMKIPLVSDTRHTISADYGVLKEDEGIAYRCG